MNPKALALIVIVVVLVWLVVWWLGRQAGIRRADLDRLRGKLNADRLDLSR